VNNGARIALLVRFNPEECTTSEIDLSKFKCIDRHLTIDLFYDQTSTGKQFSIAHYTEEFVNKQDKSITIKQRVFYDESGKVIYVQAKMHTNGIQKNINLSSSDLTNSNLVAFKLLNAILEEKIKLCDDLLEKSNKSEQELSGLFLKCLKDKTKMLVYDKKFEEFVFIIKKLNRLMGRYKDQRNKLAIKIQEMLHQKWYDIEAKAKKLLMKSSDLSDSDTSEHDDEHHIDTTKAKTTLRSSKEPNKTTRQQLIDQLWFYQEQLMQISKKKRNKILEKVKLLEKIRYILLLLAFNEYDDSDAQSLKALSKKDADLIKKLEIEAYSHTEATITLLYSQFEDACLNADLENVKFIFRYVQHKINKALCTKILKEALKLNPLQNEDSCRKNDNLIAIMKFLYENSPIYNMFVPKFSETISGILKESGPGWTSTSKKIFPLFQAAFNHNLILFNTLLEQGASPNSAGIYDLATKKVTIILKACCELKLDFMKSLLQWGATIQYNTLHTLSISYNCIPANTSSALRKSSVLRKREQDEITTAITITVFRNTDSILYLFISNKKNGELEEQDLDFFEKSLVKNSSLLEIMIAFQLLVSNYYSSFYLSLRSDKQSVPNNRILFCGSENDLHKQLSTLVNHQKPRGLLYAYYLPKDDFANVFRAIRILYTQLVSMIGDYNINKLVENILSANAMLEQEKNDDYTLQLKQAYMHSACLLLSFKDQLDQDDLTTLGSIFLNLKESLHDSQKDQFASMADKYMLVLASNIKEAKLLETLPEQPPATVLFSSSITTKQEEALIPAQVTSAAKEDQQLLVGGPSI